jgi:signal transduction histidine kinase/CheY-like chemotaxis protein
LGAAATYPFFLGAVMLSSWISGLGPGLLSTVLGTLAADYYLLPPLHTLSFDASRVVRLSVFFGIAVLISSFNGFRRRALAALAAARAELEHRVKERTAELARSNEDLRRAQIVQTRLVHDLAERVKELRLLHDAGRLLNEPAGAADVLPRIVELLPSAWQYPDVASARIAVKGIDARTAGFERTPWLQRAEFAIAGGDPGSIEVAYKEARPPAAEGPFLAEERSLIDSLAAMLHAYFERLEVEEQRLVLARSEAGRQQAQEANAAKDQFLATLSHELRTPLGVMQGWVEMLRTGEMNPELMARGFGVLDRSVRLQSKLIDDLLDVSRIVAGKLRIEKRRIDLAVIVGNAIDAARPAARHKGVTLTAALAPRSWMDADPQRLQQVVSNLLTNALKFTPQHGSIDVALEHVRGRAQIVVRDSGIGMSAGLLPRIFDRFQQADGPATRTHAGLGLGLAIVKHIVEQHGGQIAAASDGLGCGSTFTVTFPLASPCAAIAEMPTPAAVDPSLLSRVRVLVVDDEADTRATLRAVLEQFGAHPTMVASAPEAFAAVHENPPDVLLSDIVMPGEDGYALIRRIRASLDADHLPAAALSGHVDMELEARAADAGFQECLMKPVDANVLAHTLARLAHRGSTRWVAAAADTASAGLGSQLR